MQTQQHCLHGHKPDIHPPTIHTPSHPNHQPSPVLLRLTSPAPYSQVSVILSLPLPSHYDICRVKNGYVSPFMRPGQGDQKPAKKQVVWDQNKLPNMV